jgi:hypothetical protein
MAAEEVWEVKQFLDKQNELHIIEQKIEENGRPGYLERKHLKTVVARLVSSYEEVEMFFSSDENALTKFHSDVEHSQTYLNSGAVLSDEWNVEKNEEITNYVERLYDKFVGNYK